MTNIVNLTPHPVNIVTPNGVIDIPVGGEVARCSQTSKVIGEVNGIPITSQRYGEVYGLPAPVEGTVYIVSHLVAAAATGRADLFIPGPVVRDEEGRIIDCDGLSVL